MHALYVWLFWQSKSGFPSVEVLATPCEALCILDERKHSAGITLDTSQILPSSNQNI
jgi:hypothetical protein